MDKPIPGQLLYIFFHRQSNPTLCKAIHCLLIICYTCLPLVPAAEIYKWTDEKGNVHFGDRPPGDNAEKMDVKNSSRSDGVYSRQMKKQRRLLEIYGEERQENKMQQAKARDEKAKREVNCKSARKNLREIKNAGFLYEDTGDPFNPRILSNQERTQETKKAEAAVAHWCD